MVPSSNEASREAKGNHTTTERKQVSDISAESFEATVLYEQNVHGAMTMRNPETGATFHIVAYGSPELRAEAERLEAGAKVELRVSRVGDRGDLWRAEELSDRTE